MTTITLEQRRLRHRLGLSDAEIDARLAAAEDDEPTDYDLLVEIEKRLQELWRVLAWILTVLVTGFGLLLWHAW